MCEEQNKLQREWERLELALGQSLSALNRRVGELSQTDYQSLRAFVELARKEAKLARIAFDTHIATQKC